MEVILATDSLHPPLTGIGRYTYELASGLLKAEGVDRLRGYDLGRFHDIQTRIASVEASFQQAQPDKTTAMLSVRRRLSSSVMATTLLRHYMALRTSRQFSKQQQAVFHSPNFYLPKVRGPSVITIHDLTHRLFPQYHPDARVHWLNKVIPASLGACSHVICVSESTRRDFLSEYSFEASKVSVIYPGVGSAFYEHTPDTASSTLGPLGLKYKSYFLSVATIEPRKNLKGLVRAYLSLAENIRSQIPLVLVGKDGWSSPGFVRELDALHDQGIRRTGYVRESLLPGLYSGALCFVYPSYYEGFGLPVIEAQACGAPIITSDVSSLPEAANPDAILINPTDIRSLSSALERSIEDSSWREQCRSTGLSHARKFFWDRCVEQTLGVYRGLL